MPQNSKQNDDKLCGVNCAVQNCTYHAPNDSCHADQIKVDCRTALTTNETSCSTFQMKR